MKHRKGARRRGRPRIVPGLVFSASFLSVVPAIALGACSGGAGAADAGVDGGLETEAGFTLGTDVAAEAFIPPDVASEANDDGATDGATDGAPADADDGG